MKRVLLIVTCILLCVAARAASMLSYLYIQGDKQTPFYVKVEEAMQPRFGKNYCIVPQLAAGETHIQILFQQNAFAAQNFTINMPESGSRGFLLLRKDTAYALYDLMSGTYLSAGNTAAEDIIPASGGSRPTPPVDVKSEAPAGPIALVNAPAKKKDKRNKKPVVKNAAIPAQAVTDSGGSVFINGIELGNNSAATTVSGIDIDPKPAASAGSGLPQIVNTDCPAAISSEEFSGIFHATNAKEGDEDRIDYLSGQMQHCYASWMARSLAMRLQSDAARFSLLKKIYPRISDQGAFPLLDDLLTAEVWKAEFAKLVHH